MTTDYTTPQVAPPPLAAGWYPDPLDMALRRYFDGDRWTFWTSDPRAAATPTVRAQVKPEASSSPHIPTPGTGSKATTHGHPSALREDIAAAKKLSRLTLGAEKEIRLLEPRLRHEEKVLALCAATGDGTGVLACTNQRLLFFFSGIVRNQFLEVDWNAARHVIYDLRRKRFMVYTVRLTKRAVPAMAVTITSREDAIRIARAAETASAAPRLDMM